MKEALNIYKKEKSWSAENDMIESLKTSKVWVPYISEKNQMDILRKILFSRVYKCSGNERVWEEILSKRSIHF